ncbi:MAG: Ig domain-containing protein [Firmicutes bacterium]|nr:Ig domain-containing protein [Bacillota bacterium]
METYRLYERSNNMKFKRIAAVTLTSALLGSFCTGAFADNNQTEIKLLVADKYDSDYVMTIPTNLTIESDGFNALSGLTVAHNSEKTTEFNPNSKVKVTATSEHSWKLTSTANGEIGYTLKANSGDTDATTSWEFTANEITNDGTTKTLGVDVEPYANAEAGEYTDTITFTAEVESSAVAVTGIELNKASTEIKVGENETLTATVSPEDATDKTVTWESSNTSVATVDENGKVTAVAAGTANITATAGDKTATCAVTVKAATKTVTWDSSVLNNINLFEVN